MKIAASYTTTLRRVAVLAGFSVLLTLAGCRQNSSSDLRVGVTPGPAEEILDAIKPDLEKQGIHLKIVPFTDYVQPDMALASGDLDANLYQNTAFLALFNRDHGAHFVSLGKVYLPPMAIYAGKTKSLAALQSGARIALPNDPVNEGRGLHLLETAGLIKLAAGNDAKIADNPKHLVLQPIDAAQLPRSLEDVDLAVINANFALDAGLNPRTGSLLSETADSPYANVLAVNSDKQNVPQLLALAALLTGEHARTFVTEHYHGAIYPAK
ncbi:MetQ/NlpA family ABC transporter substrate-binding protein [Acidicapsa ligni]|uniref:MetQ/NlpA family ABC transporter substrate-binding protein n=1 Tax=Acidicapsa ligni TaxID=542300 RepID=UPI0021DFE11D|nr:MetQ/NlpA family ABC transporter substrate-binding protein [Acidicapsa ligni]